MIYDGSLLMRRRTLMCDVCGSAVDGTVLQQYGGRTDFWLAGRDRKPAQLVG